jgi:hypothetical protein
MPQASKIFDFFIQVLKLADMTLEKIELFNLRNER